MQVNKVGVVGCGLMGSGIAEASLRAGYAVLVGESDGEFLEKGKAALYKSFSRDVGRGKITEEEKHSILQRLEGTIALEDFSRCDLVIEAAPEILSLKQQIFQKLDQACYPNTILATNTSCLSVTEIANATRRQERVLGMHFFNPVMLMRLVELVKTELTSASTLETARGFTEKLGKVAVLAPDTPGFIVNRLLTPFLLEAMRLLETGQVTREDLDKAVKLGLNHPMGPLALGDYVGLDTALSICKAMYEQFKDERFSAPLLLKKMVDSGELGRKTGKGFYDYSAT